MPTREQEMLVKAAEAIIKKHQMSKRPDYHEEEIGSKFRRYTTGRFSRITILALAVGLISSAPIATETGNSTVVDSPTSVSYINPLNQDLMCISRMMSSGYERCYLSQSSPEYREYLSILTPQPAALTIPPTYGVTPAS